MICAVCKASYNSNVKDYVRDGNKKYEVSNCVCCDSENFEEILKKELKKYKIK